MPRRILVTFPADRPYEYYTGVWHFAEALWAPIVDQGLGTLHDIDHGREVVRIDLAAGRHAGEVKRIVRQVLKRHRLDEEAIISSE